MRAYGGIGVIVARIPSSFSRRQSAISIRPRAGGGDPPMLLSGRPVWIEKRSDVFTFANNLLTYREFLWCSTGSVPTELLQHSPYALARSIARIVLLRRRYVTEPRGTGLLEEFRSAPAQ